MEWIKVAQVNKQWPDIVGTVLRLLLDGKFGFLTLSRRYQISKEIPFNRELWSQDRLACELINYWVYGV
jgi:hypothetical protein